MGFSMKINQHDSTINKLICHLVPARFWNKL